MNKKTDELVERGKVKFEGGTSLETVTRKVAGSLET